MKKIYFAIVLLINLLCLSNSLHSQGVEWLRGLSSTSVVNVNDIASDNQGNVVAVGTFFTSITIGSQTFNSPGLGYSVFVAKFNPTGGLIWLNAYSSNSTDIANAVTCDANGNIYVGGTFQGTINFGAIGLSPNIASNAENFLVKINPSGIVQWGKSGGRNDISTFDGHNMRLHYSNGHVYYMAKYYNNTTSFTYSNTFDGDTLLMTTPSTSSFNRNIFISKIDTNGTKIWTKSWLRTNTNFNTSFLGSIRVASNGDVYCSTTSSTNVSNTIDSFTFTNSVNGFTILRLSDNGNPLTQFSAQSLGSTIYYPLIEIVNDNIFLLNATNINVNLGSFASNGVYLAKFTPNLTVYQVQNISAVNVLQPKGFIYTQDNKIALTGMISGVTSVGGISRNALTETFTIKIDTLLQNADFFEVSSNVSTTLQSQSYGITSTSANELYIGGRLQSGHTFGFITYTGAQNDGFVVKYVKCNPLQNNVISPPNPVICGNQTVTLSTNVNNNPIFNIQWLSNGIPIGGSTNTTYSASNVGNYSVYVDSLGCRDTSTSVSVTIGTTPTVSVTPSSQSVCGGVAPFTLVGGSPAGGTWSGNGVVNDSIFNPILAGAGTHLLTYSFTNASGCSATASRVITVQPLPSVFIFPFSSVCQSSSPFSIVNNGFPQGGTFTGNGVVGGTQFNPSIAGVGVHTLTYTYADIFGCQASTTANITVNPSPSVSTQAFNPVCQSTFSINLTGGSPSGGTWSGNFVVSNQFYPLLAGAGSYSLVYSVTQNGCTATDTQTITVDPPAVANLTAQSNVCINGGNITLNGTPAGGTYFGNGVSGNTFNPSVAGIGSHLIRYAISNACGTDTASVTINVNPLPLVSLNAFSTVCVNTAPFILSGGSPLGGTYSGNGISGNTFFPSLAGVGTHSITYNFTDANGCSSSTTQNIAILGIPTVSLSLQDSICLNASSITLNSGTPIGGSYSGAGVSGNTFNPASAGVGTHAVVYTFADSLGCSNADTQFITVFDPAPPVWTSPGAVCISSGNIALSGANPVGGTFSGTGVSGSSFNPNVAGIGLHTITYTISTACGNKSVSDTIRVHPLPNVSLSALSPVCIGSPSITLSGGSPMGGTFSGTGVNAGQFNPNTAGVGTHTISYTFTNSNGCSNTATQNITVNPLPTLTFNLQDSICFNAGSLSLNTGLPLGGSYSGNGVSGNTFSPTLAGIGTHTISYSFTNSNGCSNTITQNITVYDPSNPSWSSPGALCISSTPLTLTGANPAGGAYSGNGVSGGQFNPSIAGVGLHTITYTISTACGNRSTSDTIRVYALPTVSLNAFTPVCLSASTFTLSGGSPVGGSYSGNGVSGGQFNPSAAGVGSHTISYTFTDVNGCSNSSSQTIVVNPLPSINFNLQDSICLNAGILTLSATPAVGSFSGNGVIANNFNPLSAGVGQHTIIYSFSDANGCSNSLNRTITVYNTSNPTWSAPSAVCISSGSINLSAGSPSGGSFSGTGVSGNTFSPSTAGVGLHTITYTISTACGNRSTSDTIRVNPLPTVNISALSPVCVSASPFALSGGTPIGGSYSGVGVSGNQFNPQTAGVGSHTITYSFTDANTCANTATQTITVYALPTITFNLPDSICQNASALLLAATPSGGTFSGPGVSSGIFTPASAGLGTHTIIYNFTDANSCSTSDTQTITVYTSPVSWSAPAPVCISVNSVPLSAGVPAGGTFSGSGVMGTNFIPLMSGIGVHIITYTVSTACGSSSISDTIRVHALPSVNLSSFTPVCVSANAFTLSGGTPTGGSYSGNGVSGNVFNPAVAGVGTHPITYTFTNANGCSNTSVQNITVNALPNVSLAALSAVCIDAGSIALSGGLPIGGTYSGNGVSGSNFNPSVVGVGTHPIVYSFTNANGCSSSDTQNITVNALPTVNLNTVAPLCVDAASVSLSGSPTGGSFSGNGVTGNSFNPTVAGVGVHPVIYTFTDANSCNASDTQNITVNALPSVTLNSFSSVCINASPVNLSGGSPTGGVFSGNGVTASQFNPQTAGVGSHTITYSYTDANGCSASDAQSIVVNDTTLLSFNGPITLCNSDSLAALNWVSPSGGSYSGNFINNNVLNLDSVSAGVNAFSYTFSNAAGCVSTLNDVFTILPRPTISHSALDSLCSNSEPYALIGGMPSGGIYTGPGVNNNIFNQFIAGGAGTYPIQYIVTDSNGCSNSILLPIYVGATPTLNVTRGAEICEGDSVRISASGASSYQWSTNERTASIMVNPTSTSTYFVTGTNLDGCSNTDSVLVVVNPLPIVNLGNDTVICLGNTLNLDAGNGFRFYTWNTGANTQQISVPLSSDSVGSFTYIVVVEDLNGCLGTDSIQVSVQNCTGIELRDLSSHFNLYPNPSNGNFSIDIQWPTSEEVEIILTTSTGRLVFTQKHGVTNTRQQIAFNEQLANGVYFISIKGKAGLAQKRVMVNK